MKRLLLTGDRGTLNNACIHKFNNPLQKLIHSSAAESESEPTCSRTSSAISRLGGVAVSCSSGLGDDMYLPIARLVSRTGDEIAFELDKSVEFVQPGR